MSKSTISTFQLFKRFPDAESARIYLESLIWKDGPVCPTCHKSDRLTARKKGNHRCNACKLDFNIRTRTIFGASKVPLHRWIYAMYLLVSSRKGISSTQLAKEIGVTQKTAWFVLHRLREACGKDPTVLKGIVEIDETYIGGKGKNKHANNRQHLGRGTIGKTAVVGMRERGGRTKAMTLCTVNTSNLHPTIQASIETASALHTDEHSGYQGLSGTCGHGTVTHSSGEYCRDGVTANGIESVWVVLKRGLHGVYHHASPKHLGRYVDEFTFRLNYGEVKRHTTERLDSFVTATVGRRITYRELTA